MEQACAQTYSLRVHTLQPIQGGHEVMVKMKKEIGGDISDRLDSIHWGPQMYGSKVFQLCVFFKQSLNILPNKVTIKYPHGI